MLLNTPLRLEYLAREVGRRIASRLGELGSPDVAFDLTVEGDGDTLIQAISPVEAIEPGSLTFAIGPKYLATIEASSAAAVVVPPNLIPSTKPYIRAPEPRLVFSVALELAGPPSSLRPGRPETLRFQDRDSITIGPDVVVGDFCYLGAGVRLGRGTRIYPHVFIDDGVTIGEDCLIYPQVTILRGTTIGRKVIIHAGTVIGDDGFSYNQFPDPVRDRLHHLKNEHFGSVVIEDHVEVGSQVCIDRGLVGPTVIGAGTKIDNLVQIAHNCRIGPDSIIVAQVGLAGHAQIGARVFLLGQAGLGPGVKVGDDAIVTGQAGVTKNLPAGRRPWAGVPAQPLEDEHRQTAMIRRELPRLRRFFSLLRESDSLAQLKASFFGSSPNRKMTSGPESEPESAAREDKA